MPEKTQPQNQPSLQPTNSNKILKKVLIVGVIFIGLAVLFIVGLMAFMTLYPTSPRSEKEKTQNADQEATKSAQTSPKVSKYSIPNVAGYEKSPYPGSSEEREIYGYFPTDQGLKDLISNINLVVFRSETPERSVMIEMELSKKDLKKIELAGADAAYSGCSEKKVEDDIVVRYDYENCAIAFYKGDLVVVIEAIIPEEKRETVTKVIGDQLLAEVEKFSKAVISTID